MRALAMDIPGSGGEFAVYFFFLGQMTAHDDFATYLVDALPRVGLRKYPGFLNHWSPKLVLEGVEGGRAGRGIGGRGGGCDYGVLDVW